jgi:hypothetical protein
MTPEFLIISNHDSHQGDTNLAQLANFLGIKHSRFVLNADGSNLCILRQRLVDANVKIGMSAQTYKHLLHFISHDDFERDFFTLISHCLIYDLMPGVLRDEMLCQLSNGAILSIIPIHQGDADYSISVNHPDICRELAGLSFDRVHQQTDLKLRVNEAVAGSSKVISISDDALFVRIIKNNCEVFFYAGTIADISTQLTMPTEFKNYFSQIIPIMMFLKYTFQYNCWHNLDRQACVIIDDPLLKTRYGFLNYKKHLKLMEHYNFSTSIAFIPWNHKRSKKNISEIFRQYSQRLSICVHGLNHTKSEFAINDLSKLNMMIKSAKVRMNDHAKRSGVQYDNVMVFPQGKFSLAAMKALKLNGFLAAVNTDIVPVTDSALPSITLADYLGMAIMNYDDFPLFTRKYPHHLNDFALDLFLEKPALIVIHHDDLKDGSRHLTDFISAINRLNKGIHWDRLSRIIEKSYTMKHSLDDEWQVMLYANSAIINNSENRSLSLTIVKKEGHRASVDKVLINDRAVPFSVIDTELIVKTSLQPKSAIRIKVCYVEMPSDGKRLNGIKLRISIAIRRFLSEMRDDYVSRNATLLKLSKQFIKLLH